MKRNSQPPKSREALLLLYLADELGAPERADVDRRLANDPQLAAALDSLRSAHEFCNQTLSELDRREHPAAEHLAASEATAARGAIRLVRQWALRRRCLEPAAPAARRGITRGILGIGGLSAAASILIGYMVWTGFTYDGSQRFAHPSVPSVPLAKLDPKILNDNNPGQTPDDNADVIADLSQEDQLALLSDTFDLSAADDAINVRFVAESQSVDLAFPESTPANMNTMAP
jgi:hypothetical protein